MSLNEKELLEKQRRGARITALIVGAVAFGVFLLTIYLSSDPK